MNFYQDPQYESQIRANQRNHTQVITLALDNRRAFEKNLLGLLINIVVIIVLLLSRKSWGG